MNRKISFIQPALEFLVVYGVAAAIVWSTLKNQDEPFLFILAAMLWCNVLSSWLTYRRAVRHFSCWQNDAFIFANVVKQLYRDDPIVANAVWKKAAPNTTPPWHMNSEDSNTHSGDSTWQIRF